MNKGIAKGVSFDNIHSFNDLNLIFAGAEIPPATPKENYIDIPGADSSLDLTEALGEVKYNDRSGCKFTFTMNPDGDLSDEAFEAKKTEISNLLNGTVRKITLDKDPDYYYLGRCTVNGYAQNKKIKQFVISAKVKPYKYRQNKTEVFIPLCGKNLFNNTDAEVLYTNSYSVKTSVINNGLRVSHAAETFKCNVIKVLPFNMLVGKTISLSVTMTPSGTNTPAVCLGYISADGETRVVEKTLKTNGSVSLFIEESTTHDYIGLWLYSNYSNVTATADDYVDYTNIQVEIGKTATNYEPYQIITPQDVILSNSRKTVVPIINCTNEIKITFNDNEYLLNAGTHKILDLQLYEGDNPITVDGSGMVTFTYQEGDL